jgi:WD40 repeat protein
VFSPDGDLVLSQHIDPVVKAWSVADGELGFELQTGNSYDGALAFDPSGSLLAVGTLDGSIGLWDVAERTETVTVEEQIGQVTGVAFSPDGNLLASTSWDNSMLLWDVDNQSLTVRVFGFSTEEPVFSPDGKWLAFGDYSGQVILLDVTTNPPAQRVLVGSDSFLSVVAFSSDGALIAGAPRDGSVVAVWDVNDAADAPLVTLPAMRSVVFSEDGQLLATYRGAGAVELWGVPAR